MIRTRSLALTNDDDIAGSEAFKRERDGSRAVVRLQLIRVGLRARSRGDADDVRGLPAVLEESFGGVSQITVRDEIAEDGLKLLPRINAHGEIERPALRDADERGDVGANRPDLAATRINRLKIDSRCEINRHRNLPALKLI